MSTILLYIICIIFGVLFGNFATSFIHRIPAKKRLIGNSLAKGVPPHCASCGKTLKAFEYMPLIGYLVLRGKCQKCKAKIPFIYPMTELFGGLAALILVMFLGVNYLFVFSLIFIVSLYSAIIITYIKFGGEFNGRR